VDFPDKHSAVGGFSLEGIGFRHEGKTCKGRNLVIFKDTDIMNHINKGLSTFSTFLIFMVVDRFIQK